MVIFYILWLIFRYLLFKDDEFLNEENLTCSDYTISVSGFDGNIANFDEAEFVNNVIGHTFKPPNLYIEKFCFAYDVNSYLELEKKTEKLKAEKSLIDTYRNYIESDYLIREGRYLSYNQKINLYPPDRIGCCSSKKFHDYIELVRLIDENNQQILNLEN